MKKKVVLSVAVVLLLVMVTAMCVACTPNADNLKKKLEKKGYAVEVLEAPSSVAEETGVTKSLSAMKEDMSEFVEVIWFSDSKKQNDYYNEMKDAAKDTDNAKVVKKGKAVVVGTKNAVKLV